MKIKKSNLDQFLINVLVAVHQKNIKGGGIFSGSLGISGPGECQCPSLAPDNYCP